MLLVENDQLRGEGIQHALVKNGGEGSGPGLSIK